MPQIGRTEEETAGGKVPWRGSSLSYGLASTATTFTPAFELTYNPTVSHRLGLMPEWHFNDTFHVRSRFFLSQEFTKSDSTNTLNEVEVSDLWLDGVWAGWKEKLTGIKVDANLRLTFPTSKPSQMQGRIMTIGPGVNVTRGFNLLSGLIFTYSGRTTYRFNRFNTFQNQGPSIDVCGLSGTADCPSITGNGLATIQFDVLHGPTVVFLPHPKVTFAASMFMQYGLTNPLPGNEALGIAPVPAQWRNFWGASVSIGYQPWDTVGFTLGAFTFANQLVSTSDAYIFPIFNRNTVVSLDVSIDVESFIRNVTPKEKS